MGKVRYSKKRSKMTALIRRTILIKQTESRKHREEGRGKEGETIKGRERAGVILDSRRIIKGP